MKKKPSQIDIDALNDKLVCKIFDLYEINDQKFYIDKDLKLLWDSNKEVVGIINNKQFYFFDNENEKFNLIVNECKNYHISKL